MTSIGVLKTSLHFRFLILLHNGFPELGEKSYTKLLIKKSNHNGIQKSQHENINKIPHTG
jgi:hypothetical protein